MDVQIIPSGLLKQPVSPRLSLDNVELRATLEKAVEDANLNVTERMALNKKFFPQGDGFALFPKNETCPRFNIFYKPGSADKIDSFTREIQSVKLPENICKRKDVIMRSSKGCFKANLDNALKKLSKVLKNNI